MQLVPLNIPNLSAVMLFSVCWNHFTSQIGTRLKSCVSALQTPPMQTRWWTTFCEEATSYELMKIVEMQQVLW